ncbi:hypothetical protein CYLTODRAFT_349490 [Cylindrobasidium torrendii FP15055 ss-10]|uniref:PalH-domain-containing protein n=1 Tax=Cylindrobasidium torrendii FP15055 ss-10 TaxID=1314674 RepID=A0A0D7BG97_9AGAR|nr:hypothetical protein CYLTODRAFT_349490 [Cylindrobasidium torrendii FP15055 ss-10]
MKTSYDGDPYLQYRPAFARSLPVQILLTGIVLTLVSVLFIHLLFTAQYHWPLAPVNYVLQISGVITLLVSLIATLQVVLSAAVQESQKWPYMLSYIAVNVPPSEERDLRGWSIAEKATWMIMNATTSGLIQITHIQFLTLLYPSKLEARLVFSLLVPLAIIAAVMQLLPIHGNSNVDDVAGVIRNICNATLSLIFTVALFVWGILVNREQAWRTDGGTAAFGCAALSLAVVSTALNFLYVPREEEYLWLPSLIWAVILWQSFLGWWWWVGAGSGSGLYRYDESTDQVRRSRKRRPSKTSAAANQQNGSTTTDTAPSATRAWRRRRASAQSQSSRSRSPEMATASGPPETASSTDSSNSTLPRFLPDAVHQWYAQLRRAHSIAARKQAMERVERIREMERAGVTNTMQTGWGLGSFAWRAHRPPRAPSSEGIEMSRRRSRPEVVVMPQRPMDSGDEGYRSAGDDEATGTDDNLKRRDEEWDPPNNHEPPLAQRRQSAFWWGPLRRWRLQDSTIY